MYLENKNIYTLPNDKFLDWSKMKAFADNKWNLAKKLKFVLGRVENIVIKGENAGYQHFLPFPKCFQKTSFERSLKVKIVWKRVNWRTRKFLRMVDGPWLLFCSNALKYINGANNSLSGNKKWDMPKLICHCRQQIKTVKLICKTLARKFWKGRKC